MEKQFVKVYPIFQLNHSALEVSVNSVCWIVRWRFTVHCSLCNVHCSLCTMEVEEVHCAVIYNLIGTPD